MKNAGGGDSTPVRLKRMQYSQLRGRGSECDCWWWWVRNLFDQQSPPSNHVGSMSTTFTLPVLCHRWINVYYCYTTSFMSPLDQCLLLLHYQFYVTVARLLLYSTVIVWAGSETSQARRWCGKACPSSPGVQSPTLLRSTFPDLRSNCGHRRYLVPWWATTDMTTSSSWYDSLLPMYAQQSSQGQ